MEPAQAKKEKKKKSVLFFFLRPETPGGLSCVRSSTRPSVKELEESVWKGEGPYETKKKTQELIGGKDPLCHAQPADQVRLLVGGDGGVHSRSAAEESLLCLQPFARPVSITGSVAPPP